MRLWLRATAVLFGLTLALAASGQASADLLSRLLVGAEKTGVHAARGSATLIDNAALQLKALPADAKGAALAAHVGAEGHWTFVNRAGERFTASGPEELKRAFFVLAPEAAADARLTLVLTEVVAFRHNSALKDLPKGAVLRIAVDAESFPLIRRAAAGSDRLYAEVRPSVLVELSDRWLFDEAMWQLSRPLVRTRMRVLALEPGGPQTLSSFPRLDPATKRALPDRIDPDKLAAALPALTGQTVVVTGRIEGSALAYRLSSGAEHRIVLKDLIAAAEASDVGVVVLQSAAPRQPGTRNWLWLRVDVDGLEKALERATVSDFLDGLTAGQGKLLVTASDRGGQRTVLRAIPVNDEGGVLSGLGGIFKDMLPEVAGRVVTSAVEADMSSESRQRELDARLIPGIHSGLQYGYLALLVLGLIGLGPARGWWRRIWPSEQPEGYAGMVGYWLASALRGIVFTTLFMPLVSVVSAPAAVVASTWETLVGLAAIVTWPFRALRRAGGA